MQSYTVHPEKFECGSSSSLLLCMWNNVMSSNRDITLATTVHVTLTNKQSELCMTEEYNKKTPYLARVISPTVFSTLDRVLERQMRFTASCWAWMRVGMKSPFLMYSLVSTLGEKQVFKNKNVFIQMAGKPFYECKGQKSIKMLMYMPMYI